MPANNTIQRRPAQATQEPRGDDSPEVGRWYWVKHDKKDRKRYGDTWLGCVVHVGSNYVKLKSVDTGRSYWSERVHFDEFWEKCTFEPNAEVVIRGNVEKHRSEMTRLMKEVETVTQRLGVSPIMALGSGSETEALAVRTGEPIPQYKKSLIKAKQEVLPKLFKGIEREAERMAGWMKAQAIPLEAQSDVMRTALNRVDRRILAVDLYAGLSESAKKIKRGKPAEMGEPLHLMQRRHYMDEECLVAYKAGGMSFHNILDFDKWLRNKENLDRILPFPRCVVAFRVRRNRKDYGYVNIQEFINLSGLHDRDKITFLYARNGMQVWRINTVIDFGEKLFPDSDRQLISSGQQMWARQDFSKIEGFISDNEHTAIMEERARKQREYEERYAEWESCTEEERGQRGLTWPGAFRPHFSDEYLPFDPNHLYYDDMVDKLNMDIEQHNRIVMVLQGLLDRSEVFHPHPPWKLWSDAGFVQALRLVYDEDRALVAGEKPDFEAYRDRLNASLKVGSHTVGQEDAWLHHEKIKEYRRRGRDWDGHIPNYRMAKPYGNPGPGLVAKVARFMPRARKCVYHWERERMTWRPFGYQSDHVQARFTCPASRVLNVDAYTPGDYKQFFDDPRTRAEYLEWAPLLLAAEDFHAKRSNLRKKREKKKKGFKIPRMKRS